MVLAEGRWRRLTRRLSLGIGLALCGILAWFILAGPVFTSRATDDSAKAILGLAIAVSLIAGAAGLYREQMRIRPPKDLVNARGA